MEEQLTTAQVAKLLNVSDMTIRRWIDRGEFPGYRVTSDSWYRIDRVELERYAEDRRIKIDWTRLEQ